MSWGRTRPVKRINSSPWFSVIHFSPRIRKTPLGSTSATVTEMLPFRLLLWSASASPLKSRLKLGLVSRLRLAAEILVPKMLASLKFTFEDLEYSVPADFFDWVFSLSTTVKISPTLWARRSSNKPLPREAPKMEPSATAGVASAGAGTGAQKGSPGLGISRCTVAQACSPRTTARQLHLIRLFRYGFNIPITLASPLAHHLAASLQLTTIKDSD